MTEGAFTRESGGMSMTPVARMMSPDLKGSVFMTCLTPMTFVPPVASVMLRTGSPLLSFTITWPVRSKLSPVRCAKMHDMTSVQFVNVTANMAQSESMDAFYQICGTAFKQQPANAHTPIWVGWLIGKEMVQ